MFCNLRRKAGASVAVVGAREESVEFTFGRLENLPAVLVGG
jgi:hypothetical protein